jgi:hypothetical protein
MIQVRSGTNNQHRIRFKIYLMMISNVSTLMTLHQGYKQNMFEVICTLSFSFLSCYKIVLNYKPGQVGLLLFYIIYFILCVIHEYENTFSSIYLGFSSSVMMKRRPGELYVVKKIKGISLHFADIGYLLSLKSISNIQITWSSEKKDS